MSVTRRPARRGRAGRRPGGPDTRGEILAAARVEFSDRAFDGASIRSIAARAGVDPALVHHYFGTKEQLFLAALDIPFVPSEVAAQIVSGPIDTVGERAVRTFLLTWGDPVKRAPILALLRSAMTHDVAAALLRQFATRVMLARVVEGQDRTDRISVGRGAGRARRSGDPALLRGLTAALDDGGTERDYSTHDEIARCGF